MSDAGRQSLRTPGDALHISLLSNPPEEAVIEARIDAYQDGAGEERANAEVGKVLDALRSRLRAGPARRRP